LFTVSQSDFEKVKKMEDVSIIGVIREAASGKKLVLRSDQVIEITAQGWTHF
jgi:thiamine-monophosphate kinase